MYRVLRTAHKVLGLIGSLFLILIAITGFFLALKSNLGWVRPETQRGSEVASLNEVIPPGRALEAALAAGIPELKSADDVDRFEFHVGKNVYKVLTKEGYREIQVDGKTAEVLGTGVRNDQFFEDVHDLSFFQPALRTTVLPGVALILLVLGITGVCISLVPVLRRAKHRRSKAK